MLPTPSVQTWALENETISPLVWKQLLAALSQVIAPPCRFEVQVSPIVSLSSQVLAWPPTRNSIRHDATVALPQLQVQSSLQPGVTPTKAAAIPASSHCPG